MSRNNSITIELPILNSVGGNHNAPQQSQSLPTLSQPCDSSGTHRETSIVNSTRSSLEGQILTQNEVDRKPWKFIGYHGYSRFLCSDTDFLVFQRFDVASTRLILRLQDRVSILQERLEKLDRQLNRREAEDIHNGSFRQQDEEREKVLDKLQIALFDYSSFLLQQGELRKYPVAPPQDIQSLLNWHTNHNSCAIAEQESNYLSQKHDLISLVPKIKTPLRRLLERSGNFKLHWLWKDKDVPELPLYDQKEVRLFSDRKIDRFITVVITALGTVMLIIPLWVLPNLKHMNAKLGTITAFVVVFLGLIAYATVAKPFESLAAAAAYAALLTVFMQLSAIN